MDRRFRIVSALFVAAACMPGGGCDQIAPPGMSSDDDGAAAATASTPAETPPPTTQASATLPPGHPPIGTPPGHPPIGATTNPAAVNPDESETVASFLGLSAPKPATWVWHPPLNSMRKANYTVPGAEGNDQGELIVFFFGPGQGGGVDANIDRWVTQFRAPDDGGTVDPHVHEMEADGMAITMVELAGDWRQMGQNWYTPDQLFLAAIVEAPVGRVFLRLTGPTATVEANRQPFVEMVEGLKKTGP